MLDDTNLPANVGAATDVLHKDLLGASSANDNCMVNSSADSKPVAKQQKMHLAALERVRGAHAAMSKAIA